MSLRFYCFTLKFFLPQVAEINSPQPMDVTEAGLSYDLNGL